MRISACLAVVVSVLVLTACGADPAVGPPSEPPAGQTPTPNTLYSGNGLVCEEARRGPRLWLGGVPAILGPPPCGGIPLVNWDWQAVEAEERQGEKTWGRYRVVGAYDGETLVVTEVGRYRSDPSVFGTNPDFSSPCPEPARGWTGLERATQEYAGPPHAYARRQSEYSTSWNTHLEPAAAEFGPVIVNVVFTGDAERHEAEMRRVWSGPLCVVERDVPTARELHRIRREVEAGLDDLGLEMLWSSGPAVEPVVEIGVVVDVGGKAQAALDARYGTGVVRLAPALTPVS